MQLLRVIVYFSVLVFASAQGLGGGILGDPAPPSAVASTNPLGSQALLAYTAMDANPTRLALLPFLQNFGPVASSYFARGGFDKFYNALMSDAINNMLSQSTGLNPIVASFLTNNIVDTPDKYLMTNLLLGNRRPADGANGGNGFSPLSLALLSGNLF